MSFSRLLRFSDPSSIALLGVMLMASSTFIYYFYSKASSSNSSEPKKEEPSSDSNEPKIKVSTSTSSIQTSFKYDVFISFRGEDTRKKFVGHLYEALQQRGIYTFKDDEKMKQGKTIDNQLIQAIKDSRCFIIVFSKNYASSSWCLDELAEIMECQMTGQQTAYPIFLDVEPTHVRKQSGAFGKAFLENRKKDAAGKWIQALKGASNLVGRELQATSNGNEAEFIKKIVGDISLELRPINPGFDEKLVGMETRVKEIVSSLEVGNDEVRMIGIKGMGGAGKTTTARAVFDHLSADFEATSFVENVREVSSNSMFGLKNLQEQVLLNVLKGCVTLHSVTDGKKMMKARMCGIKVLLVLDDVDDIEQLEALAGGPNWFKLGSRIIVTTRNEQVLVAHIMNMFCDIDTRDEQVLEAHRVKMIRDIALLTEQEAICLFSRYAFGTKNPVQGYEELSGEVVRYAAGLPLTLRVLGSFLWGKDRDEWVDAIKRLKEIPLQETLEKLELSYNGLQDDYKEIFLDIACMLKRKPKADAITILESCGFHARIGLKVLEQRSLITVDEYGCLDMHDHIEEMGKNIVRRLHPREPSKHSRLWIDEEIEDILAKEEGTEETRCLKHYMSRGNSRILLKGLGKMMKLRYLEVFFANCDSESDHYDSERGDHYDSESDLKFDDISQCFSNSLKYLKCRNYPFLYLPKTFQANNLVGLEMEDNRMVQLLEEGERKVLKKLKFLSLKESNLTTFDFGLTPNIETLSLERSGNLEKLCMPFSCQKLKHLNISHTKLRTFDLGLTPNLETLSLEGCAQFEELHVPVACPNLKILNLSESRLRRLDLELFPNLEKLDLAYCDHLVEIKAPVGCLRKLVSLDLHGCLRFISFQFLSRCEPKVNCSSDTLYLDGDSLDSCPLHPNSNLPKFQFTCRYEEYLPSSVGNIEKLISFGLCACTDFEKFSDMICSLQCLQKLTLEGENIPEFPKDLGQLECLEELELYSEKIKHLPDSICMLKHLKYLILNSCALLEKLPEDIGQLESLESLDLSFTMIKHLPDSICMLKHLKYLSLNRCDVEKLPGDIGQLESLESLDLSFTMIKHLPDSICMLKHLKYLNLDECALFEKLPEDLGLLECLKELNVSAEKIKYLPDSICMLKCLKSLIVHNDLLEKLPEDLGQLECLEELDVSSEKIEFLPDSICMLQRLKSLKVAWCCRLGKLPEDISQLESLERLTLWDTRIKHLPNSICMLKRLKSLDLKGCALLEKLPKDIGRLECLKELCLSSTKIKHLPDSICLLKHLKSLNLDKCDLLEKLPEDLGQLESLEKLNLSATSIKHLPDSICMLKRVEWLDVTGCHHLGKLPEDIGKLESLEFFFLSATSIKHLPDSICLLKHLSFLNLKDCALLEKPPEDLGKLECLKELIIENTGIISDLPQRLRNRHLRLPFGRIK